ncbi:nucleolar protein [Thraustotheca clavata]|uniref:Nucleolar protein n=1 Tax=Thraustotheca clavata TaxID=74557 RepID=A0A1W0ABJ0_9STRA|nr:nucleolar protein [Thraustotheca clavata]
MGKKERLQAVGRGKMKENAFSRAKGNAFDVQKNSRSKFEVLGKKIKGQGRNVAQARAMAEERRRSTLLKQFQKRKKNNEFKDRRLGEQSEDMSLEDKMLARFQTERKKQYQQQRNASKFNLNDDDDNGDNEEDFLTHRGQKIDDYENLEGAGDFGSDMDEEDRAFENKLGREMVHQLHFGGGANDSNKDSEGKKKTHEEIMHEVMMKSKMYKAEKQKNKATQDETTEVLDAEFAEFQKMLSFRPKKADRGPEARGELDEFDKMARMLSLEAKAKATERSLTPEEIAKREREKLADLEKQRIARMNGEDESDTEAKPAKKGKKQPKFIMMRPPPATDDDLTDNYHIEKEFNEQNESDEDMEQEGGENGEEDDDEDLEEEEEEEEEDNADEEEDEDEDEEVDEEALERALKKRKEAAKEIPYVLPCPATPADLSELFEQYAHNAADRNTIIDRLRKYYSPKLSAENKDLTKKLFAVLLRQFLKYAANYDKNATDLNNLTVHIYNTAQDLPDHAGALFRDYVTALVKKLHKKKSLGWPDMRDLLMLRVALQVFPTSDLRHNVVSPIELLINEAFAKADIASIGDIRSALFCIGLSLTLTKQKEKYSPEVVYTLDRIVKLLVNPETSWWLDAVKVWLAENGKDVAFPPLPVHKPLPNEEMSAALFNGTLTLLDTAATQYASLPCVHELFNPIERVLLTLKTKQLQKSNGRLESTIAHLHDTNAASLKTRKPLRMQTFAPTVLPTFIPKFDENYAMRKDKTADRDKAQLKQLQRQVKRERKGASRELRRDAAFLARERQEEHNKWRQEKQEKQREIRAWMEEQNATFNQQVRKGGELLKGGGSGPAKKRRISKK